MLTAIRHSAPGYRSINLNICGVSNTKLNLKQSMRADPCNLFQEVFSSIFE